jgi:hypothetical protein
MGRAAGEPTDHYNLPTVGLYWPSAVFILVIPNPDEPEPKSKTNAKSWTATKNAENPHE